MKSNLGPCPICGEGQLHLTHFAEEFTENGKSAMIDLRMEVCDHCESEVVGKESARANKRAVAKFRKEADGLLTGEQVAAFRAKYDLRQEEAAAIFGGGPVAFSKYEADDVAQSTAMDRALRVCEAFPPALFQYAWIAGKVDVVAEHIDPFVSYAAKNIQARGVASHCDLQTIRDIVFETLNFDVWKEGKDVPSAKSSEIETKTLEVTRKQAATTPPWSLDPSNGGQRVKFEKPIMSTQFLKTAA
ncbi:putative zinc finger/helix-turn-helix protein, YgiT family [Burkholderia cepacia]|uniref:type II toxin-antitoxin system MqsA family antitoxin n=1 Tax=Burkholderia cepacia TaxID=292 RepID=UPI0008CD52A8|nr:type II toxin-antitoxin system MqsA family antitoxin [Burkholderia cepacia]SEU36454.1 putative zinc finger/helix-turn-helix protein, YgiT family [Burkholderia cepacia]